MEDEYRILIQHSHIELQTTLILVVQTVNLYVSIRSLIPRLSPHTNEKLNPNPNPLPLFRTGNDGKLGGAWERGYSQVLAFAVSSEMILVCSEALWS